MCAAHFSTGGIVVQVQLFLCILYHRYLDSDALRLLAGTVTGPAMPVFVSNNTTKLGLMLYATGIYVEVQLMITNENLF